MSKLLGMAKDWSKTTLGERLAWMAMTITNSADKLSLGANMSRNHARNIINGVTPGMNATTARKYAERWGVSDKWLVAGIGEPLAPGKRFVETGAGYTIPDVEEIEVAESTTAPGRWRRYAQRYWTFRAEATVALEAGVKPAVLDAASDMLGAQHADGPTEEQARQAIDHYRRRLNRTQLDVAGRDATEADFDTSSTPAPATRKGRKRG